MTAPPKDLATAQRIATEAALKAEEKRKPKPTAAEVVRKSPSPVRIACAR